MEKRTMQKKAFLAAFPKTIPIFAGFLFIGAAYGIYMNVSGFNAVYSILMSLVIYAGSVQFLAVGLLLGVFDPLGALLLTLMVNARHLFYGLSMLDKYKGTGLKKFYMVFGLTDETFSVNCTANIPEDVDEGWFMFFVTLLNHFYWVLGTSVGALFGSLIRFNTSGLEFVMTALFVVLFLEQQRKEKSSRCALLGLGISFLCLVLLGGDRFIIPSMLLILGALTLLKRPFEKAGVI